MKVLLQSSKRGGFARFDSAGGKDRDALLCFERLVTVRLSVVRTRPGAAVAQGAEREMQLVLRGPCGDSSRANQVKGIKKLVLELSVSVFTGTDGLSA
jgi:hypothetical protein